MAVTRDVQGSLAQSSGATLSISLTIGGTAGLCVVYLTGQPTAMSTSAGANRITGVAIGGNAFTLVYADPGSGGTIAGEVWALLNPPSGVQNVIATRLASGFAPLCMVAKTYLGVDTSSLANAMSTVTRQGATSTNALPTTYTANIVSGSSDITESVVAAGSAHTAVVASAGAVQTQDTTLTDGNSAEQRSGWAAGTGGTVAHTWDLTADLSGRLAYLWYFSVKAGAGAGGGLPAGVQSALAGESVLVGQRLAA